MMYRYAFRTQKVSEKVFDEGWHLHSSIRKRVHHLESINIMI